MFLNMELYRRCFRSLEMHSDHRMEFKHPITPFPFIILSSSLFSVRPQFGPETTCYEVVIHGRYKAEDLL